MTLGLAVAAAAAVGAMARYLVDQVIQHQHDMTFPWGTFVINVVGSFVLGLVTGLASHHGLPKVPTTVIGVGICGGFTTWSTYCWETLALAETGSLAEASLNVLGSVAVGFGAAAAGLALALA
jgi:CrcB protein